MFSQMVSTGSIARDVMCGACSRCTGRRQRPRSRATPTRPGPSPLEAGAWCDEGDRMDRLTPLAASFLEAEDVDERASLAIGSLAIFEGPAPDFDEFVASIQGRLPLIPRYRQKVRRVLFDLAAPVWVDDPDFDLGWHIHRAALPSPGGRHEIEELFSRVMTERMDRSRPLWEYWLCEGLRGPLGPGVQDPPQHGRRCLGIGPLPTRARPDARPSTAVADDWQPAAPARADRLHPASACSSSRPCRSTCSAAVARWLLRSSSSGSGASVRRVVARLGGAAGPRDP